MSTILEPRGPGSIDSFIPPLLSHSSHLLHFPLLYYHSLVLPHLIYLLFHVRVSFGEGVTSCLEVESGSHIAESGHFLGNTIKHSPKPLRPRASSCVITSCPLPYRLHFHSDISFNFCNKMGISTHIWQVSRMSHTEVKLWFMIVRFVNA